MQAEYQRLQETSIALKVLLEQREKGREDLEMKVISNVRKPVLPCMEKLHSTPLTSMQEAETYP